MALQERWREQLRSKETFGIGGNGPCSFRGELRGGISKNKKVLNRKVRHRSKELLQNADYKKVCRTVMMVNFT